MNLRSLTLAELADLLKTMGQPSFRAKQVYTWLHRGIRSFDEMTDLPKTLRTALAENYPLYTPPGGAQAGIRPGRHYQIPLAVI